MTDEKKAEDITDEGLIDVGPLDSSTVRLTQSQALPFFINQNHQNLTHINSSINVNEFVRASLNEQKKEGDEQKDDFWDRVKIEIALNFVNPERFYLYIKSLGVILVIIFFFVKVKFPDLDLKKEDLENYLKIIFNKP